MHIQYFVADVADDSRVKEVFEAVKEEFGTVDVVVSNAGYLSDPAPIKDAKLEDWWKAIKVNVNGIFIVMQSFLLHTKTGGTLIGISTALAHATYYPNFRAIVPGRSQPSRFCRTPR